MSASRQLQHDQNLPPFLEECGLQDSLIFVRTIEWQSYLAVRQVATKAFILLITKMFIFGILKPVANHKSVFLIRTGWCKFMGSCRATDTQYTLHTAWCWDPRCSKAFSLEFNNAHQAVRCRPRPLPLYIRKCFLNLSGNQARCLVPRSGSSSMSV